MNKGLLFPLIIGVLSVILSCCSTETKEISLVSVEKTSSLRQEQMTVINSCLPHIIPKEAYVHARKLEPDTSVNLNLFVYGIFCVLDSTTIQSLVEQGGSPLLTQLNKKHTQSESINPANLESFHRVHVSCIPPMT